MGVLLDVTPLRVLPQYRRLWFGQGVNAVGTLVTSATLPYQVFHLTGSSLAVGLLGVVQLVPLLALSVVGGAFADSLDKRRMMLVATTTAMCASALLLANAALAHPHVWPLFLVGGALSGILAFNAPATRSLVPRLVPVELRPSAYALQSTSFAVAMTAGPALGGLLIAGGLPLAYGADVLTFVVALVAYAGLDPSPPAANAGPASAGSLRDGLGFLRAHPVLLSSFGVDLLAMVFGMPRALFPALTERLGGGPELYGVLVASVAAGGCVAGLTSGWIGAVRRHGRAVLLAVAVWGAAIAAAGFSRTALVVLGLFAVAGAADTLSGAFRATMASDITPDDMRGRVGGVEFAVYGGGPVLGDVEAGVVGGLFGVPFAIVSGGLACLATAVAFATAVPAFARYSRPDPDRPPVSAGG